MTNNVPKTPPNINAVWGTLIVEELVRNGVGLFCLSPGSRCAPLTVAVAENARAQHVMHFDERGAAYHALGCAAATGRPAALICTSGTAVANYFPAVVEASHARVPLIVLSADRPPELLDAGANQAIDQVKLFGDYARWYAALPCPTEEIDPKVVLTTIDQAVYRATSAQAGPVHLNCMFREPLAPVPTDRDLSPYMAGVASWQSGDAPYTAYVKPARTLSADDRKQLAETLSRAEHGLLIVGRLASPAETKAVGKLAEALNWPVFPDVASGLRLGTGTPPFVHYYDTLLGEPRFAERCAPDVVVQVGSPVVSKRLLEHLDKHRPQQYILVTDHPFRHDPAHGVSMRVEADVAAFCSDLAKEGAPPGDAEWRRWLWAASEAADEAIAGLLAEEDTFGEPAVARLLSERIAPDATLFVGNSMPVRDVDRFGSPHGARARVAVNRGASGIDGNIAAAAGYARVLEAPVTALVGDLALLHDLNSLALLRDAGAPVTVVVLNNNGGGIFSFLPIADYPEYLEEFFVAPHGRHFKEAAALFDLDYYRAGSRESFVDAYEKAPKSGVSTIIEVGTDRHDNVRLHRLLEEAVAKAVAGA